MRRPLFSSSAWSVLTVLTVLSVLSVLSACTRGPTYDVIIRDGTVYDGSGQPPVVTDIGVIGDSIAGVGNLSGARARRELDATGMAVAPGFINMLSWANEALIVDGRSQSDLRQGVTLEVFGEGNSMGPWNDSMKAEERSLQGDIKYDIQWSTLGEYLDYLVSRGISPNVASFVGATTVRKYVLGHASRAPDSTELARMQDLVRQAMQEGALGVGSSLIYEPAFYASTDELAALAATAHESGGMYISHIRNENDSVLEAVGELITIARRSGAPAEIYHLKAAGRPNWGKLDSVIALVNAARAEGLRITADMYTYPASATGLDASMPAWVRAGGLRQWETRMRDRSVRRRVITEMRQPGQGFAGAGGPQGVLLIGFKQDSLKYLTGKTLAQVAALRGKSAEETAMDLVIQDDSRIDCIYFTMSEDNVRRETTLPWVSFGSDAESSAPEGVFLLSSTHPRAYGNFSRLLAKYVRDDKAVPLEEAVRRLSNLPATNLGLRGRGALKPGYFADIVIFDPATIQDHATFEKPMQYATGVRDVFVNGVQVIRNGEHTDTRPGRVVRGPGYTGKASR
jgi:N-acyl-D-amino-acid deacylase